ncbi:MAG: PSD1 domain-containing protein [Bryobacterales bacterium]|nr:PSD1 domain-containing protein [Bryobacterales bacterium]
MMSLRKQLVSRGPRLALALCVLPAFAQSPDQIEFFEKHVRPVLARNCQGCHNAKVKSAELDMSSAAGFAAGGQSGPLVAPGDPVASRLLRVVRYDERLKMPPGGKLKDEEIASLEHWVKMGAPWPGAAEAKTTRPAESGKDFTPEEKSYWAFQPVRRGDPPAVRDDHWVRSPVDRFILAALEAKGIRPAPAADKLTLLRRATFDLTGLPPTENEIAEFLADETADAFAKVVDRLLASPRYGERWGRHWLDVARYADSTGNDEDHRYPYAWRYRDYVIDAFNRDLPFDQFVREQVAGDLLPGPGGAPLNRRGIVATGFLALGPKAIAQQDKKKMLYDVYDEQVDVTSRAFMGLTVACARCHDHKFDPIRTKDYYSLISIFASTKSFSNAETHVSKLLYTPLVPENEYRAFRAHQDRVAAKKAEIDDVAETEVERYVGGLAPKLSAYLIAAREVYGKSRAEQEAAAQRGLDAAILAKWVKFLQKPAGEAPYIERWQQVTDATQSQVAAEYQKGFEEGLTEWNTRLRKWRETVRRMQREMNMPPPPKPRFEAETNPFFQAVYFGGGPFAVPEKERETIFSGETKTRLAALRDELKALEAAAPPEPDMACAVQEGEPVEQPVFIRGDYESHGEVVPKAFPAILTRGAEPPAVRGSGRLKFADWLTSEDHPLTARVMANRIWLWHFGEGMVRTPDNFGTTGERPSHPELLDFLAARFIDSGWSVKAMHRLIMLSSAYQMGSTVSPEANSVDPENRLLSRFHRRRLDVEEMRDAMLAIDGSLDLTMGGTLQSGFGTDSENSNDRLSLRPEAVKRRMVYVPLRRANLPPLLNLFDFGDATTMAGKRALTNVAPQALFSMNSEFVLERSRNLAGQLIAERQTPAERLEAAYLRTLNRRPAAEEKDQLLTYLNRFGERFGKSETEAWQSVCRILLASNEFLYVD